VAREFGDCKPGSNGGHLIRNGGTVERFDLWWGAGGGDLLFVTRSDKRWPRRELRPNSPTRHGQFNCDTKYPQKSGEEDIGCAISTVLRP